MKTLPLKPKSELKKAFFIALFLYLFFAFSLFYFWPKVSPPPLQKRLLLKNITIKKSQPCCCMVKPKKIISKASQKMDRTKIPSKKKQKRVIKKRIHKKVHKKVAKAYKKKIKTKKRVKKTFKKVVKKSIPKEAITSKKEVQNRVSRPKQQTLQKTASKTPLAQKKISYQTYYKENFLSKIIQSLLKYRYYPRIARKMHRQGIVKLKIVITPQGVEKIEIVKGSGWSILDRAAIKTVWLASKEFPKAKERVELYLPMEYRLR